MQELQLLNDRLDQLLKKYSALQAENIRLKATIGYQLQSIEHLNEKLEHLEHDMIAIRIGKNFTSTKADMRKQLDSVIGEIDKILHTLND